MRVAFGLGSNIGDRVAHLRAAVAGLAEGGVGQLRVSSAYETDPVGGRRSLTTSTPSPWARRRWRPPSC